MRFLDDDVFGIAMVIQVFMDESGIHDDAPAVTSSAVWTRPSVWQNWTKEWKRKLAPIEAFHAVDCHNRKNEFAGWSRNDRDKKVIGLLPIIPKFKIHGRFTGVDLKAYNLAMESEPAIYKKTFGNPYYAAVMWAMKHVAQYANTHNGKRVDIIHEVNDFQTDVLDAFDYVSRKFPSLNMTLNFGSKKDFVPLQAADILAYEGFKYLKDGSKGRLAMSALDPTGKRMRFGVYDRLSMQKMILGLRQYLPQLISEEALEISQGRA